MPRLSVISVACKLQQILKIPTGNSDCNLQVEFPAAFVLESIRLETVCFVNFTPPRDVSQNQK